MYVLKISKSPISKISISDDLASLVIESDLVPSDMDSEEICRKACNKGDIIKNIIMPEHPEEGIISSIPGVIELSGLNDILYKQSVFIRKLSIPNRDYEQLIDKGFQHTIEIPIEKLYQAGYINSSQLSLIKQFVKEKLALIRQVKQKEVLKNSEIIKDVDQALKDYRFLRCELRKTNGKLDNNNTLYTFQILEEIGYRDGNLKEVNSYQLIYLLLFEGWVDHLLQSTKSQSLIKALIQTQKDVITIVRKNRDKIISIIEEQLLSHKYLHRLYTEYKLSISDSTYQGKMFDRNNYLVTGVFPPEQSNRPGAAS